MILDARVVICSCDSPTVMASSGATWRESLRPYHLQREAYLLIYIPRCRRSQGMHS